MHNYKETKKFEEKYHENLANHFLNTIVKRFNEHNKLNVIDLKDKDLEYVSLEEKENRLKNSFTLSIKDEDLTFFGSEDT